MESPITEKTLAPLEHVAPDSSFAEVVGHASMVYCIEGTLSVITEKEANLDIRDYWLPTGI